MTKLSEVDRAEMLLCNVLERHNIHPQIGQAALASLLGKSLGCSGLPVDDKLIDIIRAAWKMAMVTK